MKYYSVTKLCERLSEEGLPSTRVWIYKMMKKGKLNLPKFPFSQRYALTESIIDECVQWLKREGYYRYDKLK